MIRKAIAYAGVLAICGLVAAPTAEGTPLTVTKGNGGSGFMDGSIQSTVSVNNAQAGSTAPV